MGADRSDAQGRRQAAHRQSGGGRRGALLARIGAEGLLTVDKSSLTPVSLTSWLQQWFMVLNRQLTVISAKLDLLIAKETKEMATLDDVHAAVAAQTSVVAAVTTLLQQLSAQLSAAIANADDPAKLQELVDEINANANSLANAVAANTPGTPGSTQPAPAP